jgi:hypothetical protein
MSVPVTATGSLTLQVSNSGSIANTIIFSEWKYLDTGASRVLDSGIGTGNSAYGSVIGLDANAGDLLIGSLNSGYKGNLNIFQNPNYTLLKENEWGNPAEAINGCYLLPDENLLNQSITWDMNVSDYWNAIGVAYKLTATTGSVPSYWNLYTTGQNRIATYETGVIDIGQALPCTLKISNNLKIYTSGADDQTFPNRTNLTYPDDTDQILTIDDTPDDYEGRLFYATTSTGTPSVFTEYKGPVDLSFRYFKVRQITTCNYSPAVPIGMTNLRVVADMKDVILDITNLSVSSSGTTVTFLTYGKVFSITTPSIQVTVSYGSGSSSAVSLAPVISNVTKFGFTLKLLDIVGVPQNGTVNVHVRGY